VAWITYLAGQSLYLDIGITSLVLLTMSLGSISGALAITKLEPVCGKLPLEASVVNIAKMVPRYSTRILRSMLPERAETA